MHNGWASYASINQIETYTHEVVIRECNFADPEDLMIHMDES